MSNIKKIESGITLITLVITIIVLLILAGVTIATLTGENGVLTKAKESEIYTNIAAIEEQAKLKITELKMNDTINEKETINGIAEDLIETGDLKRIVKQENDGKTYLYYLVMPGKLGNNSKNENLVQARDVYGLNDDLTGYYIDKSGNIYGNTSSKIELVDDQVIKFFSKGLKELTQKELGITSDEITYGELKRINKLTISDPNITDLSDLIFFTGLKDLSLQNLKLKNLQGIENCTKLTKLTFQTCSAEEYTGLRYLENLNFLMWAYDVNLDYDSFVEEIKDLENITNLQIYQNNIKEIDSLLKLKSIKKIKTLSISYNQISNIEVLSNFDSLEKLYANYMKIENINALANLRNITQLYLSNNNVKDVSVIANMDKIKILYLDGNQNITEESLAKLSSIINNLSDFKIDINLVDKIPGIKSLTLNYLNLTNEDIQILGNVTTLERLDLSGNQKVTDISPLVNLKNLKNLGIRKYISNRYKLH